MFCTNCGNKIDNNSKYCTNCGVKLDNNVVNDTSKNISNKNDNGMKIASIILGAVSIVGTLLFVFAPFALILSIIGLVLGLCALKKGSNVSGIVLSSVGLVLSLIVTVIMLLIFIFMVEEVGTNNYQYEDYYDRFYQEFDRYYNDYGLEDF